MEDGSVGKSDKAVVNFGNDVACGIGYITINNIEEFMLDEEDPCHVRPGAIILGFERREIEFRKCELSGMELVESNVVGCGWYCSRTTGCCSCCRHVNEALWIC